MLVRKKPVIVEAFRWTGDEDQEEDPIWIIEALKLETVWINRNPLIMHIETLEGVMDAKPGDYIIKGIKGELYPCKPDIFEKTYSILENYDTPPIGNRVLCVEDDEAILKMWVEGLEEFGCVVKGATDYRSALGYEDDIDFVITDLKIPVEVGRLANEKYGLNVMKYYRDRGKPVIVASYSDGLESTIESYGARKAESKDVRDILKEIARCLK